MELIVSDEDWSAAGRFQRRRRSRLVPAGDSNLATLKLRPVPAISSKSLEICGFQGFLLPQRGGRFFASVRIRTGDLYLSERQRADTGITAKARQRYALCQFATAHKKGAALS